MSVWRVDTASPAQHPTTWHDDKEAADRAHALLPESVRRFAVVWEYEASEGVA